MFKYTNDPAVAMRQLDAWKASVTMGTPTKDLALASSGRNAVVIAVGTTQISSDFVPVLGWSKLEMDEYIR